MYDLFFRTVFVYFIVELGSRKVVHIVLMGRAPHLRLFDKPGKVDHQTADAALDRVGMLDLRDRPYTQLSGGQRQMVMIARGVVQQCDILLMDEPDAHLDPRNQHVVMNIVRGLIQDKLLLVTGEIGAGKTTWTRDFIDYARTQQAKISGLLSPAIFEDGLKTGIALLNLTTGEQRQLARLRTDNSVGTSPDAGLLITMCWLGVTPFYAVSHQQIC